MNNVTGNKNETVHKNWRQLNRRNPEIRNLPDTVAKIIDLIPRSYMHWRTVREKLSVFESSLAYIAPEAVSHKWLELGEILRMWLPYPSWSMGGSMNWTWDIQCLMAGLRQIEGGTGETDGLGETKTA